MMDVIAHTEPLGDESLDALRGPQLGGVALPRRLRLTPFFRSNVHTRWISALRQHLLHTIIVAASYSSFL